MIGLVALKALLGFVTALLVIASASSRFGWGGVEKVCHVTLITISLAVIMAGLAAILGGG